MGAPDIAVVVPTFRRPDRAARLLDALEAQTLDRSRWEVVMVDDCSGDGTFEQLEKRAASSPLAIRIAQTPTNRGPAGARNHGLGLVDAPLVAFTDDDCVPAPGWLAAGLALLERWPAEVGVVQGRTEAPPDAAIGDWTLWRQILTASPWFEACNIFYRREPLVAAGGFDEALAVYGEDAAAGWGVVDQGWRREFADDAVVVHDVEERGFRWHVRYGLLERNLITLAARHPGLRKLGFWKPWAFRHQNAAIVLTALGLTAAALRPRRLWPAAVVSLLPTLYMKRWFLKRPRLLAELLVVDAAQTIGHVQGSIRNRVVVL